MKCSLRHEEARTDLYKIVLPTGMLRIENEAIDVIPCTKHLGVVLSRHLDWHDHINELLLKAAPPSWLLRWMLKVLRPATTAQLYLYFLRPKLEYASPVWHGNLLERDAMAIERVQTAVARSILCALFSTPKRDLFQQLTWLPLCWRREIASIASFIYFYSLVLPCLTPASSPLHRRSAVAPCGNHTNLSSLKHIPVNISIHFSTGHH